MVVVRNQFDTVRHWHPQAALDGDTVEHRRQPKQAREEVPPVTVETECDQSGSKEREGEASMHPTRLSACPRNFPVPSRPRRRA